MGARKRVVRVLAWARAGPLKRLVLGATKASGGLLSLGGMNHPWVQHRLFLRGFSLGIAS